MGIISKNTGSVFFKGLNAFWTRIFKDSKVFDDLYGATETLLGDVYLDLMEAVLAKSLRSTVVFSKKDWQLLLLANDNVSFDPPVYSSASSKDLGVKFSVTALELSARHDGISLEVADSLTLTSDKRAKYPTYGAYNVGLIEGSAFREHSWVIVAPTGKTVFDSVLLLSRRVIGQKKIDSLVVAKRANLSGFTFELRKKLDRQGTWSASTGKINGGSSWIPAAVAPSTDDGGNEGQYYEVTEAGSYALGNETTWAVGDWVISVGGIWKKAPAISPRFQLRYGLELSGDIELAAHTYTSLEDLRLTVETALKLDPTLGAYATAGRIKVLIEGGHLAFTADKDITMWDTNTACEEQLYLKEFRFKIEATIPPGREGAIFWTQNRSMVMQTAGYRQAGTEYRFPVDPKVKAATYIYNTIYAPSVIMESPANFRIAGGFIYFKDNPFALESLAFRDLGGGLRQLALWMTGVSVDDLTLYFNFGYRYTGRTESSEAYRAFLRGLWYYFTHGPQRERIRSALNIVSGIPVVAENDEIVLAVSSDGTQVLTDKNTYVLDAKTPASVSPGDTLQAFDTLTDVYEVEDYISHPHWYDQIVIPENLMPNASIGYRVSAASTFIPKVGDAGFICGDVLTESGVLVTNAISPQAPSDYSLPQPAFFTIEKDRSKKTYNVYVPVAVTQGATTLENVATYLSRATKQLMGNSVDGAGGTIYRLYGTASFTLSHQGTDYQVSVTKADTSAVTSLSELVAVIDAKILAATATRLVTVYGYLSNNAVVLIPKIDSSIKISGLNASATNELGLFASTSLLGIRVEVSGTSLVFSSTTTGQSARVKIAGMDAIALDYLGMRPFRQGSGDFFGPKDADSGSTHLTASPGWDIMDKYLKYNTFRVKFNPSVVDLSQLSLTIPEIISKGRPLYTNAIILPEYRLEDRVSTSDVTIDNLADIGSTRTSRLVDRRVYAKAALVFSGPDGFYWRQDGDSADARHYQEYAQLSSELQLSNISSDGGSFYLKSKSPGLAHIDHLIEVTDQGHIKPEDSGNFGAIGIFNRGRAIGGVTVQAQEVGSSGSLGGIYSADLTASLYGAHWLSGFDKSSLPSYATHVLVIDSQMRAAGIKPHDAGVTKGDFIRLKNLSTTRNNGDFAVVGIFSQVPFRGTGALVDLVFYRNTTADTTTDETFTGPVHIPSFATVSFRSKGALYDHRWLIVLPSTGTVAERLAAAEAVELDDKALFPFTVTAADGTWTAPWATPGSGNYHSGVTHNGNPAAPAFYGETYKTAFDHDPAHNDPQAQGVFLPGVDISPKAFVIGEARAQVTDFISHVEAGVRSALTFRGAWNAETALPTLPAPASGNTGDYYLVQYPGSTVLGSVSSWKFGDWLYSNGVAWVKVSEIETLHTIGTAMPYYTKDEKVKVVSTLSNTWGVETDAFDADLVGGPIASDQALIPFPYLLGASRFSSAMYVKFRASQKLNKEDWVKYGEMSAWRALTVKFTQDVNPDRADYLGPGHTADYGTLTAVTAKKTLQDDPWDLTPSSDPTVITGAEGLLLPVFGVHMRDDPYTAQIGSLDAAAGLIGAGAAVGDTTPAGYEIGGVSSWAAVIGPYDQERPIVGDLTAVPSYFSFLELTAHTL